MLRMGLRVQMQERWFSKIFRYSLKYNLDSDAMKQLKSITQRVNIKYKILLIGARQT